MNIPLKSDIKCGDCPIRHRAVCSRCNDDELSQLEAMKTYRKYAAGDTIWYRGDTVKFVASVVDGVATLGKTMEDGRTQMVGLILPSDFIGRPGRDEIDFDVVAATDLTLCCFERKPFEKMLTATPHLAERMIEMALDELDAARDWMLLLGRKTAREKIASFVQLLAMRNSAEVVGGFKQTLSLPLIQEEIANYLGLTFETVSRQFSALRKEGVLKFADRRKFEIIDETALKEASGDFVQPV